MSLSTSVSWLRRTSRSYSYPSRTPSENSRRIRKGIEHGFSLNPGPWNIKEHVLVYIMANVAVGNLYTLNTIVVAEVFYNIRHGF